MPVVSDDPATSSTVLQEIIKVIKKFKFENIKDHVMPHFPELKWIDIKTQLVKRHKNFSSSNVVPFIKAAILEAKLRENVLRDRLEKLQLIDVSFHPKQRVWYGFSVISPGMSTNSSIQRKLEKKVTDELHSLNMNVSTKVLSCDGITYMSLTPKNTKSKSQHQMPIFFALFLGQKCFFCNRKNVLQEFATVIANSMGYKKFKRLSLFGRDLMSLSKLHWNRIQQASNPEFGKTLEYKDDEPLIETNGIDFTQQKQRKKFAEMCFGDDPPCLELLVVNGPEQHIIDKDLASELPNLTIDFKWECRSRNVPKLLMKLIEDRVIVTPVPHYISNLLMLGKNEIVLRQD